MLLNTNRNQRWAAYALEILTEFYRPFRIGFLRMWEVLNVTKVQCLQIGPDFAKLLSFRKAVINPLPLVYF